MRLAILLFAWCCTVFCQEQPEFEVVSIRPLTSDEADRAPVGCNGGPGTSDPILVACGNESLGNLLILAYRVDYFRISAPDWIWPSHFNISAKVPEGTTKTQVRQMWQNLLAERFKLIVHWETRQGQVYDLVTAKGGPKFKTSSAPHPKPGEQPKSPPILDKDGRSVFGPGHTGVAWTNGSARMYYPAVTLAFVVEMTSFALGKPVNDKTGLKGEYEIGLRWDFDPLVDQALDLGLADALRDQLGLRLVSKKGPIEFLVVDHAERIPSEN